MQTRNQTSSDAEGLLLLLFLYLLLSSSCDGANLGSWAIDDGLTFSAVTHSPTTGAAADADSVPTYRVYEDETGTAILTGSMALLDDANTTGFYSEQITLSAANGLERGKSYTVVISATVAGVVGTKTHNFQIGAASDTRYINAQLQPNPGLNGGLPTVDGNNRIAGVQGTVNTLDDLEADMDTDINNLGAVLLAPIAVIDGIVDAIITDTADMQPKLGTPAGASMSADIAAIEAGTTVDAVRISRRRTWRVTDQDETPSASNVVTVLQNQGGTLRFDFSSLLNDGTVVTGISSVTLTPYASEDALTASNLRLTPDKQSALFDIADFTSTGSYTVKAIVTTVDSQTIPMTGTLQVQ